MPKTTYEFCDGIGIVNAIGGKSTNYLLNSQCFQEKITKKQPPHRIGGGWSRDFGRDALLYRRFESLDAFYCFFCFLGVAKARKAEIAFSARAETDTRRTHHLAGMEQMMEEIPR